MVASSRRPVDRSFGIAPGSGAEEVVSQLVEVCLHVGTGQRQQRCGCLTMKSNALWKRQILVQRLADQRVREAVAVADIACRE